MKIGLYVLLVVLMMAVPVLAQENPPPKGFQYYVSDDGLFAVTIPKSWIASVEDNYPFLTLASSEQTLTSGEIASGERLIGLAVMPLDSLSLFGFEDYDAESTPEDLVDNFAAWIFGDDTTVKIRPAEPLLIGDHEIGRVYITTMDTEGMLLAYIDSEILYVIITTTALDELAPFEVSAFKIIATLEFRATSDELKEMLGFE